VGDKDNEYDPQTKLYWNAKTREWGERQTHSWFTSLVAGFFQGLQWQHVLFERALGVETQNTRVTDRAFADHPIAGLIGQEVGASVQGSIAGGLAARSLSAEIARLGISGGPTRALTVDEILEGAFAGKISKSKQFSKSGGMNQANQDFDALQ